MYTIVKVDQGVIVQQRAADYVMNQADTGTLIIELKGGDVRHACRQVLATIPHLANCNVPHGKIAGLVIATRFPAVDTQIQRLQNEFMQLVRHRLKISSSQNEFEFIDLFA